MDGVAKVFDAFEFTDASKEHHCYSWMYAEVLGKFACLGSREHVAAGGQQMRMLEIGYDKGDSLTMWKGLFPSADIHAVESGAFHRGDWSAQAEAMRSSAAKLGFTVHFGDQQDTGFLASLIESTPGGFDVIIDDGGHTMEQQINSLTMLWRHVRPGGVYM